MVIAIILLEFIWVDSAEDLTAPHGDKLFNKLANRQLKAGPSLNADLDHTIFLKLGHPLRLPNDFHPPTLSSTVRSQPLARAFRIPAPSSQPLVPSSKMVPVSKGALLTHYPQLFTPRSTCLVPHAEPKRPDWIRPQLRKADAPLVLLPGSVSIEHINKNVRDDKNSLFRSLAYGLELCGLKEYEEDWLSDHPDGLSIRTRIAKFIMNNADHCIADEELKTWVNYESKGQYKTTMEYGMALASGILSGGFIEMSLFSQLWQVNLGVYRVSSETKAGAPEQEARDAVDSSGTFNADRLEHILDFASKQDPQGTMLILYSYGNSTSGRGHFDPLRPREASLVTP